MRVVGSRRIVDIRLRGPTDAEVRANREAADGAPRVVPKGVYRYRSHVEANADTERWIVDGVVERNHGTSEQMARVEPSSLSSRALTGRRPLI